MSLGTKDANSYWYYDMKFDANELRELFRTSTLNSTYSGALILSSDPDPDLVL